MPRETFTAPLTLPPDCSSGASRTSTTRAPFSIRAAASFGEMLGTSALAAATASMIECAIFGPPLVCVHQAHAVGLRRFPAITSDRCVCLQHVALDIHGVRFPA